MFGWVGAAPAVALAVVLLWAAGFKLLVPSASAAVRRSALRGLVGAERVGPAHRVVGGVEALVAVALLVPAVRPVGAVAAVLLGAGMVAYLGYARSAAPGSSCGCLSGEVAPVGARQFARAGLVVVAGAGALFPGGFAPGSALLVLLALVALSPALDPYWRAPLRHEPDDARVALVDSTDDTDSTGAAPADNVEPVGSATS
ncbi:hypothetical protein UO65_2489 [Actinokineospora spheciospongiae]|uniref:Methylamine utilisation protein MauE domain-containing protein n=1 Tax=Actinokineospora spheciospongiae TaxID=909613 RepID=W7J026_9PSEU|nr:MauE/DoxX family redox-associated membrane protein [Actinokineospora spheciospongiae]EWC62201.1 hypothetical protein UO65_2489 [Actinokineospora spheciospongiae]